MVPCRRASKGRFEFALRNLEQKALARGATREDFQRVRDLLILRARAAVKGQDGAPVVDPNDPAIAELAAKLQTALESSRRTPPRDSSSPRTSPRCAR
jgi:hypothetical protein